MVLALMATLTGIAIPPLRQLLSGNRLQVAQTDFIAALQHARETAATTGKPTLFCPTRDGRNCSNEWRWESGWLLGHNANRNNQPDQQPLYTGHGYTDQLIIHSSTGRRFVRFQPDGSASGSNLTLVFCQRSSPRNALNVVVSNSGRIRGAPASAAEAAGCAQME
ncbi:pilus assembly protein [Rhodanobacter sp. B04]|uniref:GspH/FimT family pseudopilin n=1 Tax=Rhodanobacter sp. B04 TaxID=1945860 RepID=UPI0009D569D5|nr:GspH/FimT family pseudopilin [Rhodanobacter sp. B04]OOG64099.1 pilus assembly protein [Rhodanobacter sp. B04]